MSYYYCDIHHGTANQFSSVFEDIFHGELSCMKTEATECLDQQENL